jgi:hypothetical protein
MPVVYNFIQVILNALIPTIQEFAQGIFKLCSVFIGFVILFGLCVAFPPLFIVFAFCFLVYIAIKFIGYGFKKD